MQMWVPSAFEKENHKKLYHAKYKMQILEKNHFKKFLTNDDFEKASSFFFFLLSPFLAPEVGETNYWF